MNYVWIFISFMLSVPGKCENLFGREILLWTPKFPFDLKSLFFRAGQSNSNMCAHCVSNCCKLHFRPSHSPEACVNVRRTLTHTSNSQPKWPKIQFPHWSKETECQKNRMKYFFGSKCQSGAPPHKKLN